VRPGAERSRLILCRWGNAAGMGKVVRKKQKVAEMADEVLARQARARAERTEERADAPGWSSPADPVGRKEQE
jgi:hypothetical protein